MGALGSFFAFFFGVDFLDFFLGFDSSSSPSPSLSLSLSVGSPPSESLPAAKSSSSSLSSSPPPRRAKSSTSSSSEASASRMASARALVSTLEIVTPLAVKKLTKFWNSERATPWKFSDDPSFMLMVMSNVLPAECMALE